MTELKMRISMPDGSVWEADAVPLLLEMAHEFAVSDTGQSEGNEYEQARAEAVNTYGNAGDSEFEDWLRGNTVWRQLKNLTMTDPPPPPNYVRMYAEAEIVVVEK